MVSRHGRGKRNKIIQGITLRQQLAHRPQGMSGIRITSMPASMGTHPSLRHSMGVCTLQMLDTTDDAATDYFPNPQMPCIITAILQHDTMTSRLLGNRHERLAISHSHGSRDLQSNILAGTHCCHRHAHMPFPWSAYPHQIHIRMSNQWEPITIAVTCLQHIGIGHHTQSVKCSLSSLPQTYQCYIYHFFFRIRHRKPAHCPS